MKQKPLNIIFLSVIESSCEIYGLYLQLWLKLFSLVIIRHDKITINILAGKPSAIK